MVGSYVLPSVCPSVSQERSTLGSWNLVRTWTWMTPRMTFRVSVIGQRSRSPGRKHFKSHFIVLQLSWSVAWIKVKGLGVNVKGRSWRSKVKLTMSKIWFQVSFDPLAGNVRGQGSYGSGSKVTWVRSLGLRPAQRSWYWLTSTTFYKTIVGYIVDHDLFMNIFNYTSNIL